MMKLSARFAKHLIVAINSLFILSCSLQAELGLISSLSVDSLKSYIEVVPPEEAQAGGQESVTVRVHALNDEAKPVAFTPNLMVLGEGENTSVCGPVRGAYAECTLKSDTAGTKIVFVKNALILRPGVANFVESRSLDRVTLIKNQAYANGQDEVRFKVQWGPSSQQLAKGLRPVIESASSAVAVKCELSNEEQISNCRATSTQAGVHRLKFLKPALPDVEVEFITSRLKLLRPTALAGVSGSTAAIEVTHSSLPTLVATPADVVMACAPPQGGKSVCELSSAQIGQKLIQVSVPADIKEKLIVGFAHPLNTISMPTQSPVLADGLSEVLVEITLKNSDGTPLVGVVPVLDIRNQSGGTTQDLWRCETSGSNGIAKCFIQSTQAGTRVISVVEPLVHGTKEVTFLESSVILHGDRPLAQGKDAFVLEVKTGQLEGVIPKVEIVSNVGSATDYLVICSPSVKMNAASAFAVSKCYITSQVSGPALIKVLSPVSWQGEVSFADANSSVALAQGEDAEAVADGTDKILFQVRVFNSLGLPKVGFTPQIQLKPSLSQFTLSCGDSNLLGISTCQITSTKASLVEVSVEDPLVSRRLNLSFLSDEGGLSSNNPALGITQAPVAVAASGSVAVIYLDLKDELGQPLVGEIPELLITGSGENTYICYPSNSTGVARCEIRSTEAGTKTVKVIRPRLAQTISLTFQSNQRDCSLPFSQVAKETWTGPLLGDWSSCQIQTCETNYNLSSNVCSPQVRTCDPMPTGGLSGTQIWDSRNTDKTWGYCTIATCKPNYTLTPPTPAPQNSCVADTRSCPAGALGTHFFSGTQTWNGIDWGVCSATWCEYPYKVSSGACVLADVVPVVSGILIDEVNAIPNQELRSSILTLSEFDRNLPFTLTGGRDAYLEMRRLPADWVSLGAAVNNTALTNPQAGLKAGDEIRFVSKSSASISTMVSMSLVIGSSDALTWKITTTDAIPPTNMALSHSPNQKTFSVSWGAGGIGNGGADFCELQYFKNPSWVNLAGSYNCDQALTATTVTLPGNEWVSSFLGSGIRVRAIRKTDNSVVQEFSQRLTCVADAVMPKINDPSRDEDCNGLWNDEDDNVAPLGGGFSIAATDVGDSSVTGSPSVQLQITCPTDQAGGVQVAYGNSANPTNWTNCAASVSHNLIAGSGTKTVYMRFRDAYGNATGDLTQSIELDQSAPLGGGFTLSQGSATASTTVDLVVICPSDMNGPLAMAYGNNPSPTNWTSCVTSQNHILPTGDGTKTVYVRFKDKFSNTTADTTATIKLDQTAPVPSLSYADGWLNSTSLGLILSATDAGNSTPLSCSVEAQSATLSSGVAGSYSGFTTVASTCTNTSVNVTDGLAYKLRVKATDSLGNASNFLTPALEVKVDATAPTVSGVSATTTGNQPACNTVRVSVSGAADSNSGLASSAYSFDGGSTWQSSSTKDFSTTSLSLSAGQLRVRDVAGNVYSYATAISGSAEACSCPLPWGGTINNGQSVTAYASATPMYPTTCASETRTCSSGALSGSYTAQSCTQQYSYSWYQSGWGSCPLNSWAYSSTGSCSASCGGGTQSVNYTCPSSNNTQTQTVYCQRNDGTQVSDGFCSGAKPSTSQSCWQTSCSGGDPSYSQSCNTQSCCVSYVGQSCVISNAMGASSCSYPYYWNGGYTCVWTGTNTPCPGALQLCNYQGTYSCSGSCQ